MPLRRSPIWSDPCVKPPYGSVEVTDAALDAGLVGAYLFNEGAGSALNLATRLATTIVGTAPWEATSEGVGRLFSDADYLTDVSPFGVAGSALSIVFRLRPDTSATHRIISKSGAGQNMMWWLQASGSPMLFWADYNEAQGESQNITYTAGTWHTAIVTHLTNTQKFYWDGLGVSNTSGNTSIKTGNPTLTIGHSQGYSVGLTGGLAFAYTYTRVLTASEAFQVTAEPYAVFSPLIRRRYFVPAPAPPVPMELLAQSIF